MCNTAFPSCSRASLVGGQYALIAIGYTLVYGILRLINFAHGDVFMAAGLIMVYLSASLPLPVALPLMVVLTVALGFFIERCAYKPLRSAPRMSVMISAIGVSYLLQNFATYITGGLPQMYPAIPGLSEPGDDCRRLHQMGDGGHAGAGGGAGGGADPAHQPHQDRHGHAGRVSGTLRPPSSWVSRSTA